MPSVAQLENTTYRRLALLLIAVGLALGAGSLLDIPVASKLWPALVLLLGSGFVGIFLKRTAKRAAYLASGEYLILFSGLAFYCCFTSWANMAWLWPIFIAFLGFVLISLFVFQRKRRVLFFLGLFFLSLSGFFFLVFSVDGRLWWTIFVLVGLSILLSRKPQ